MSSTFTGSHAKQICVVGSGPNGLAAAIALAQAGLRVSVIEGNHSIGGGARSAELTLPGFIHDTGSAVHPMAAISPFFKSLRLSDHGLVWIQQPAALAHPMDDGSCALLQTSILDTSSTLGKDAPAYRHMIRPLFEEREILLPFLLGTMRRTQHLPSLARFGFNAMQSAFFLAHRFQSERTRGFIAGLCAHAILPLDEWPGAAYGLALALAAHTAGWPIPREGSGSISAALASCLESAGGTVTTGKFVESRDDLPEEATVLWDVTPAQLLRIKGLNLPDGYRKSLGRYRYGPGIFKIDWALSEPIPWKARECRLAGTVHLGGTFDEIALSESCAWRCESAPKPFVLLVQPSLFDPSRAPAGKHTAWAYCHVANGFNGDMTDAIEAQVERFAPGFREIILARHTAGPADLEKDNPNLVGGDISGGAQTLWQIFARPTLQRDPYKIPGADMYLCSSSTPPGAGVHGMCGFHAAASCLKNM
ncbi:MAG: NAD(P)/FAD-dependent oxidoreductase [Dehalococcoidia bacterium]